MIKKATISFIFLLLIFNFAVISCDPPIDTCGPFPQYFETTSFFTDVVRISVTTESGLSVDANEINPQRVPFDQFSIRMSPDGNYYSFRDDPSSVNFFNNFVLACSPPIPVSEETITDIKITSNHPFDSNSTVRTNLVEYFDVIVLRFDEGHRQFSLNEFLESEPAVPDTIYLVLNSPPETEETLQFTVQYTQDGRTMDTFEFTTNPVVITE